MDCKCSNLYHTSTSPQSHNGRNKENIEAWCAQKYQINTKQGYGGSPAIGSEFRKS